jgi:hypothetical protein
MVYTSFKKGIAFQNSFYAEIASFEKTMDVK